MKRTVLILIVVVHVLAMAIPVFADHNRPNGPPPCDIGPYWDWDEDRILMVPGQGVKGNIENKTGPYRENPEHEKMYPKWNYAGGPGYANVTCIFLS